MTKTEELLLRAAELYVHAALNDSLSAASIAACTTLLSDIEAHRQGTHALHNTIVQSTALDSAPGPFGLDTTKASGDVNARAIEAGIDALVCKGPCCAPEPKRDAPRAIEWDPRNMCFVRPAGDGTVEVLPGDYQPTFEERCAMAGPSRSAAVELQMRNSATAGGVVREVPRPDWLPWPVPSDRKLG